MEGFKERAGRRPPHAGRVVSHDQSHDICTKLLQLELLEPIMGLHAMKQSL